MPKLDEGDLLYMPTTTASVSVGKAKEVLQQTDKLIAALPEVRTVHGKIGRAATATDPAPLSMLETVVQLEPTEAGGANATSSASTTGGPAGCASPCPGPAMGMAIAAKHHDGGTEARLDRARRNAKKVSTRS